ncbi:hypothetical protein GGF38_005572, partial [Coemansia sp. RSA 25]
MSKNADTTQGRNSGSARRRRKSRNNNSNNQARNNAVLAEHSGGSEPSTPTVTGTPRSESQVQVSSQELASAILKTKLLDKGLDAIKSVPPPPPAAAGRVKRRRWFIAGLVFGGLAALTGILYANPTKSVHIDRMHDMLGDFDISSILPDSLLPDDFIQDITRLLSLDSIGTDSASST